MSNINRKKDALNYHAMGRPGKIAVVPTKPHSSQRDLSLAYSPGVAEPCLAIAENSEDAYKYTAKGNLVAVISNGTAVLGLGDIGAQAGKPVMEGKGLLFKIFADIDVFDIELDTKNVDEFVNIVKALEPTFGGVNLEDIKAPECFEIERRLKAEMNIPVMHDDQHGTAIISGAALINASELQGKNIADLKIVVNGAGAAAISCTAMYVAVGANKDNIVMCDSKGVIRKDREVLDPTKAEWATDRDIHTLADAVKDADVFIGLSAADVLTPEMLKSMAPKPIVLAMANPNPEIAYELALETRDDIIMGTGRSDFPNQVNNVLGFPYIFRGALDVRATAINEAMKIAAVKAIAELAKQPVPEEVNIAYNANNIRFGIDYVIPKPTDPRLITEVSVAVAKAAIESGVARKVIEDWDAYRDELRKRLGKDERLIRTITAKAKSNPKRVVFAEADNYKTLRAAQIVKEEGIAFPILLGNQEKINNLIHEYGFELDGVEIIDPQAEIKSERFERYAEHLYQKRQRRGVNKLDSRKLMTNRNYFAASMVEFGDADTLISGLTRNYASTIRPALQVIGAKPGSRVAGMYIMLTSQGPLFFGDTTVNSNPSARELADIAVLLDSAVKRFNVKPRLAMLSYSNFGSNIGDISDKVREAVSILHKEHPDIVADGEIQANFALNKNLLADNFPFSTLNGEPANTLVFPNLESGNISYKLLQEVGNAEAVGPVLLGMNKPIHVLQLDSSVREIVNMVTIAVVDAIEHEKESKNQ
ncbi:malic enzyme [Sphingobacterium mizutaii NBRC 14946 = DSM 11724]|uniref:NADP-dependent malic enzyme n=2 Tax=Sphingobacterium mizutaii TaxID=1010 RepID=A0AAJ4X906_9SPHI|nr:NADP-dependent malic enzyme [Sphingobacterium mizutaii]GEM70173.1 malic enzyme [Sphingobacterium mizutaii NBRC 14946 = DSM 11724]SDL71864.1 allosteric NADP-dependent malic enzyme [Sphingobacterium mizutaii]SNV41429.1 NADP-dependent malic enzyme [Sphingobacterium mizutaii]